MTLIDAFKKIAPFINIMATEDLGISICDVNECVLYLPGKKINHNIKVGDPLKEGTAIYEAIKSGKRIVRRVGSEVYGFPYIAIAFPLIENGVITGGVSIFQSTAKQDEIANITEKVFSSLQQIHSMIQEIFSISKNVSEISDEASKLAEYAKNNAQSTDELIDFIKHISSETNLLGLNAAIEAARVGESGKGFTIVANEIRKLSMSTKDSVESINNVLIKFKEISYKIDKNMKEIKNTNMNLYKLIENANSELEEINKMFEELYNKTRLY
ncbi:methyl-accepting chemotaxis protein [Thermoanaerobacter indiensis]|uniref:methyl-accepting chemotaxis protein n=1 Tax=Thermoanaerobacter indiensis TaxID=1125974 RepID=UPI0003663908|nr:methyl-accepting chemotaxis protein [Thermoanaerobacter indiensis]